MKKSFFSGLVILAMTSWVMASSPIADKMSDLGLNPDGKPIGWNDAKATSLKPVIHLPAETGFAVVERPEIATSASDTLINQAKTILLTLLEGPTAEEKKQGLRSAFPEGTVFVSVEPDPIGVLVVTLTIPSSYLKNSEWMQENFDYMSQSVLKSLQNLPYLGSTIQVTNPDGKGTLPLDSFLPKVLENKPGPADTAKPTQVTNDKPLAEAKQFPRPGIPQYQGALAGKAVYLNPGHGYVWVTTYSTWGLQRSFVYNNIEDFSNVEWVNTYLWNYFYNAGADVHSVRETDFNTTMITMDDLDGAPTYTETGSGWFYSSLAGFKNGITSYTYDQNPFSYGSTRLINCVTGVPTASASWSTTMPVTGYFNVYVSHAAFTNRSPQAHYAIVHSAGTTHTYLDQRRRRFTWCYLGNFYFEAGNTAKVILYNDSSSSDHIVSADAVRIGGGKGNVRRSTGSNSGKARFEEDAVYHALFNGAPTYLTANGRDEASGWSARPKFGKWLYDGAVAYGASTEDAVFISHHTNAGGGTGVRTYVYSTTYKNSAHNTFRNYVHDEVANDIINGYNSNFTNGGKNYGEYGENSPANVGYAMPIFLGEWLFHDSATDMAMYHDPKFKRVLARAVYQGTVKYFANKAGVTPKLLPEPPLYFKVRQNSSTTVTLNWTESPYNSDGRNIFGDKATGYKVYYGTHGKGFVDSTTVSQTTCVMSGLTPGKTYFFRVTAINEGGESFATEVLAAKMALNSETPKILIVNGFDKLDISTRVFYSYSGDVLYRHWPNRMDTKDYIVEHARAIDAWGKNVAFDACEHQSLPDMDLSQYKAIIWIAGIQSEVSTVDPTNDASINAAQQTQLQNYLNGGGNLFLTGAEVAWDLDRSGTVTFVDNYLKANYVQDNAGTFVAYGKSGSIFNGINNITYDNGSANTYKVNWPDVITPTGGSVAAMEYTSAGSGTVAGVQYSGTYKLVYLGFPFETIVSSSIQTTIMSRVLDFFDIAKGPSVDSLPAVKRLTGQTASSSLVLKDYVRDNSATYSLISNWAGLASLSGSTVIQNTSATPTTGLNIFGVANLNGTSQVTSLVKYSTYRLDRLPILPMRSGEDIVVNLLPFTETLSGPAIPASFGRQDALYVEDTSKLEVTWSGATGIRIRCLDNLSGNVRIKITASPLSGAPYTADQDSEYLTVYPRYFWVGQFSSFEDIWNYGLEIAPDKTALPAVAFAASTTDKAGTKASNVMCFTFSNANQGIKMTPLFQHHNFYQSDSWYLARMKVAASVANNNAQVSLFHFNGIIPGNNRADVGANIYFGVPSTWTWIDVPLYTRSTGPGYPQILMTAGSSPVTIFIQEIQVLPMAPEIIKLPRANTLLHYNGSVLTTQQALNQYWGTEQINGSISLPALEFDTNNQLKLNFTGASSSGLKGAKFTATTTSGSIYTPPSIPGLPIGIKANIDLLSGNFTTYNSLAMLACYGVTSNGSYDFVSTPGQLIAVAQFGNIVDGWMYLSGTGRNGFHQMQFMAQNDATGMMAIQDVDYLREVRGTEYIDPALL